MKKILLVLFVAIVAVGASAPYINGYILEQTLRSQVKKSNELGATNPYGASVEISSYDRGFNRSEIIWQIHLGQMAPLVGVDKIVLKEQAQHGYFDVSSETSLSENPWYRDFINNKLDGKNPVSLTSRYSPIGGGETLIEISPFELALEDKTFNMLPATLKIHVDRGFTHLKTTANFVGLSIPGEMEVNGIKATSDLDIISSVIMAGTSSFVIDDASIITQKDSLKISNMQVDQLIDFDKEARALFMGVRYAIDQIIADKTSIDDFHARMGINRIDADGFTSFSQAYNGMVANLIGNIALTKTDPKAAEEAMKQQMAASSMILVSEMEKLLKQGLQFSLSELHFKLPKGEINGNFSLELKKDMTLADMIMLSQQPQQMVEAFALKSDFSLPKGLVPNERQLLVPTLPGMQSGLFQLDGERLVHSAQTKDSALYLNGKEFDLRALR